MVKGDAMVDEKPFRMTVHLENGEEYSFPVYLEAARDNIRRAVEWQRDAPFSPAITQQLDDRDVVRYGVLRVFTQLLKGGGEGVFYMTDDDGAEWGIPARNVVALRLEDPTASRTGKRLGFAFERETNTQTLTSG